MGFTKEDFDDLKLFELMQNATPTQYLKGKKKHQSLFVITAAGVRNFCLKNGLSMMNYRAVILL